MNKKKGMGPKREERGAARSPCRRGRCRLYWVLPGFTGFFWVLPGFTGFYRVLLSFIRSNWVYTVFYCVLLGFTGFYRVLLCFTVFYWVLRDSLGFYSILLGYAGLKLLYWVKLVLLGNTRCVEALLKCWFCFTGF